MAEITLRVPLGRPLTYQEVDDNFKSVQELTLLAQSFALTAQEASTLADEAKNEAIAAKDEALTASGSAASDAQRAEDAADRAEAIAGFDGLHNTLAGRDTPNAHDASAIGFKQSGEGAVERSAKDKFEEWVSVKDYGAKGDGITDDTAAVQKALNENRNIVFPPGEYLWAGNGPTVRRNTTVVGFGAVIKQPNYDPSSTGRSGNEFCGLRIDVGTTDVGIVGLELRGPFFQTDIVPSYRSIGINISGRYDQRFYNNPNFPADPSPAPSGTSKNIRIAFCKFDGWGQSAVIADQIDYFDAYKNTITNCCRDGIRTYGVRYGTADYNVVDKLFPGMPAEGIAPNNNVYGIEFTRIYRSLDQNGSLSGYRASELCSAKNNVIRNCWGWKGMGTHGGTDITFSDNLIEDCHIGIGVDKGGFTLEAGFAPPRNIVITGNIIKCKEDVAFGNRAALALYAHDETDINIGEGLTISNNMIIGPWGRDNAEGAVSISNWRGGVSTGNVIRGALRSGICLFNHIYDFTIKGETISNILKTSLGSCVGIVIQTPEAVVNIDDNSFYQPDDFDTMTAISCAQSGEGFSVTVGDGNAFRGNIQKFNASGLYFSPRSTAQKRFFGWANVNHPGGGAVFAARRGAFSSIETIGTGHVKLTLSDPLFDINLVSVNISAKGNSPTFTSYRVTDNRTIEVYTFSTDGSPSNRAFCISVFGSDPM